MAITGGGAWDPAWGYLFADTSSCTNLQNNLTLDAPVYVRGDLCMENSAMITSELVTGARAACRSSNSAYRTAAVPSRIARRRWLAVPPGAAPT